MAINLIEVVKAKLKDLANQYTQSAAQVASSPGLNRAAQGFQQGATQTIQKVNQRMPFGTSIPTNLGEIKSNMSRTIGIRPEYEQIKQKVSRVGYRGLNPQEQEIFNAPASNLAGLGANAPMMGGLAIGKSALGFAKVPGKFMGEFDNLPRAEISDLASRLKTSNLANLYKQGTARLGEVLEHAGLYKKYPQLKQLRVEFNPMETAQGTFNPKTFTLSIDPRMKPAQIRSTLLHEVQHVIQEIEGFAKGGNVFKTGPGKAYSNLAGELEARAVQAREGLMSAQRKATPFFQDILQREKINPKDVITRFDSGESALAQKSVVDTGLSVQPKGVGGEIGWPATKWETNKVPLENISTPILEQRLQQRISGGEATDIKLVLERRVKGVGEKVKLRINPEKLAPQPQEIPQTEAMRRITLKTSQEGVVPTAESEAILRVKSRIEGLADKSQKKITAPEKVPTTETGKLLTTQTEEALQRTQQAGQPSDSIVSQKKLFGWFDEVRRRLENEYHPVEKISLLAKKGGLEVPSWKDPELLVKRNLGSTGIAEAELLGLGDIVRPFAKNVDDLNAYLVAKRVPDLEARGIKTGINPEDARLTVQTLSPQFEQVGNQLRLYQRSILHNYLVDTGVLSEEAFQAIIRQNPNYVPFNRVMEEIGSEFVPKKGISQPIKRIKGSEREILNPLESIIENTYKAVTVGEQNRLWGSVASIGDQLPGLGIKKAAPKMVPVAQVEGQAIYRPSFFNPKENTISFFQDGKRVFYEVPPEVSRVANALGNRATNMLTKLLSYPTKFIRTGATGANPEFALVRNPIRDQFSALWNSESGYVPFWDLLNGISHYSGNDKLYRQYLASGGGQSFMVSLDREFKARTLDELLSGRTVIKKGGVLSKLQDISQFSEIGTRLGEFGRALNKTGDPLRAAKAAREVSVDFGRVGSDVRVANQLIAFLNARVQGTIQAVKSGLKHPVRSGFLGISLGALPATLLYLHNRQYPEYFDIEDYEKQQNWIVLHGEPGKAKMFEVPKDYIIGQLFGSATENFLNWSEKTNPEAMKNLVSGVANFFSPASNIGELIPSAVKPVMEHAFNYNTFLGRQIVPEYQQALPSEAQYNKGTREVAKLIGSRIGVSPAVVDNYLYGYGPGLFTQVINLVDWALGGKKFDDVAKLPFVRVFSVSGTGKIDREIKNSYYLLQDKKATLSSIAKNQNYSTDQKKGLIEKQLQEMGNIIGRMNNYLKIQKGDTGVEFETTPTKKVSTEIKSPVTQASAAEGVTQPSVEEYNFDEEIAREQLRYSNEPYKVVGNKLIYKPEGWEMGDTIQSAEVEWSPPKVKFTGIEEIDKARISSFKSDISSRIKEIGVLMDYNLISSEEASRQVGELAKLKVALSKPKKLRVKQPKFVPIKFGKRKRVSGLTKKKGVKLVRTPTLKGVTL